MSKKGQEVKVQPVPVEVIHGECPFREFRDSELVPDLWGLNPPAYRAAQHTTTKSPAKHHADQLWTDEQTQPLPRSIRHYLHGWVRAEELAMERWEAELVIFEETDVNKMSVVDMQLSHAQVLLRSSFCRRVLSACYVLERIESFVVEHQWENFTCVLGAEGWRAKYHVYSPGVKAGGGLQHRPGLSRNGCYLVRLFYLGAWRCVWVNDLVPVDANDSPLLPFSPLFTPLPAKAPPKQAAPPKVAVPTVTNVNLWPLLLCKALLKLAGPDMNCDDNEESIEDEVMPEFDLMHALTGALNMTYTDIDYEDLWSVMTSEVTMFSWDEDDDTLASTVKSRSTKKITAKDQAVTKRGSTVTIVIADTKDLPPFVLPGVTPCHEAELLVTMARDVPLRKPLPEPDVALWKEYRWVAWARRHGLYEAFDCPRTRFIKISGLLKMSYAPHLLDVQSSDSITYGFREKNEKNAPPPKSTKSTKESTKQTGGDSTIPQLKEELREWVLFESAQDLIKAMSILFCPSMYQYTSAASCPPVRPTKVPMSRTIDTVAPKHAPLYLQIDGPDIVNLKMALSVLHPRILANAGDPVEDYIEPGYVFLEEFEWYKDCALPVAKIFVQTRGFNSIEVEFLPGRHICRLWVHSRMHWHLMLLSKANLLLGSRDLIMGAAVRECPWAAIFLANLGSAFSNWIRSNRAGGSAVIVDREFFRYYQPDLDWDPEVVGYNKSLLHYMFRRALESLLMKRLGFTDFRAVCTILRHNFCDPDFGLPSKPKPPRSLREIVARDPCDCVSPEEVKEEIEEEMEQTQSGYDEEKHLLVKDLDVVTSHICDLATEELPCGLLKKEREKVIRQHEAATLLQAHWRGAFARKCINTQYLVTPETLKLLMDSVFGNLEGLSSLMNEFFKLYPGAKYAFSVASALTGTYGLQQHSGTSHVTAKCKWVPFFQGIFYCHGPIKVHFDLHSTLGNQILTVYDNGTGKQMPQALNAHVTFDFTPNAGGYTVMGNGSLNEAAGTNFDVQWMLTVLSSIDNDFHICDSSDAAYCNLVPLAAAKKLHLEEMFIPNRRNILGGVQLTVYKDEVVRFRAQASSPELDLIATLKTKNHEGEYEEIEQCTSKGELYWPYIRLKCDPAPLANTRQTQSQSNLKTIRDSTVNRQSKNTKLPKPGSAKIRSSLRFKDAKAVPENKNYLIEVTTPNGWPLSLAQWKRVDDVRYAYEMRISHPQKTKITVKEKASSAKDKKDQNPEPEDPYAPHPQPEDAFLELECSLSVGAVARRDDERDLEFAAATKAWDAKEPGRNARGGVLRHNFRTEFLESQAPPPAESVGEEMFGEEIGGEEETKELVQGPTPASDHSMAEMEMESEEEILYLTKPDQLKDKFTALEFVSQCMLERTEESTIITPERAEEAKVNRQGKMEAAKKRMLDLQHFNERRVLGRQKNRCILLEKLFVDGTWCPDLLEVLEARDEAIALQTLRRNLSQQRAAAAAAQSKKKPETKKK